MSSSDDEIHAKTSKKPKGDFQIKPASGGPSMDTSAWPLLLKVRY